MDDPKDSLTIEILLLKAMATGRYPVTALVVGALVALILILVAVAYGVLTLSLT